jgi:excinuclease ABC subunit C
VQSELDQVKGLGPKTVTKLLKHFKSVAKLKQAERKDIEAVIGTSKTELLLKFFN